MPDSHESDSSDSSNSKEPNAKRKGHPIVTEKKKVFNFVNDTESALLPENEPADDTGHPLVDESKATTNIHEGGFINRLKKSQIFSKGSKSKSNLNAPSISIKKRSAPKGGNIKSLENRETEANTSYNPEEEFQKITARFPNSTVRFPSINESRPVHEYNASNLPRLKSRKKASKQQSILQKLATESNTNSEDEQEQNVDLENISRENMTNTASSAPSQSEFLKRPANKSSIFSRYIKPSFSRIYEPSTSTAQPSSSDIMTPVHDDESFSDPRKMKSMESEHPYDGHESLISDDSNDPTLKRSDTRISVISNFSLQQNTLLTATLNKYTTKEMDSKISDDEDENLPKNIDEMEFIDQVDSIFNNELENIEEPHDFTDIPVTSLAGNSDDANVNRENTDNIVTESVPIFNKKGKDEDQNNVTNSSNDKDNNEDINLPSSSNYEGNSEELNSLSPSTDNEKYNNEDNSSLSQSNNDNDNSKISVISLLSTNNSENDKVRDTVKQSINDNDADNSSDHNQESEVNSLERSSENTTSEEISYFEEELTPDSSDSDIRGCNCAMNTTSDESETSSDDDKKIINKRYFKHSSRFIYARSSALFASQH